MTHPENEFGDFEKDFQDAEKAERGSAINLVPEGVYKVACSQQDITGNGVLVDHEVFTANSGTKGFRLFLEVLDPAEMPDPEKSGEMVKTKGEVVEKVFWVSQKNLTYLKRDIATILGRDLKTLGELTTIVWVGKTCEVGIVIKTNKRGYKENDVSYINEWKPEGQQAGNAQAPPAAASPAATPAAAQEDPGDPDF